MLGGLLGDGALGGRGGAVLVASFGFLGGFFLDAFSFAWAAMSSRIEALALGFLPLADFLNAFADIFGCLPKVIPFLTLSSLQIRIYCTESSMLFCVSLRYAATICDLLQYFITFMERHCD